MSLGFGIKPSFDCFDFKFFSECFDSFDRNYFNWLEITAPEEASDEVVKALLDFSNKYQIKLAAHARYVGVNLSNPIKSIRQASCNEIMKDIEFACRVHADRITVHGGDTGWFDIFPKRIKQYAQNEMIQSKLKSSGMDYLAQSLKNLADYAEKYSVQLLIENLYNPWDMLTTPDEMKEILSGEGLGNIGVTLDFGHADVAGILPSNLINAVGPKIKHVHIHNNTGHFDTHNNLTKIKRDWKKALEMLESYPDEIPIIFEWEAKSVTEYADSLNICTRTIK